MQNYIRPRYLKLLNKLDINRDIHRDYLIESFYDLS
ncbi:hypothetical protein SAMN05216529_12419 [Faecalicatena contorta]|uniref:Uncharacterized protein n=1 Tax=Faecalicatena contorta TaxID=39482 RepID=A0A315ZN63_9FIRM|nr:hypothetical protein A8805_12419 [Faecalicatena contorta]SUQ16223.1 hypothetical protein SAMN05216529_12419 [Faecalicatena contorta]